MLCSQVRNRPNRVHIFPMEAHFSTHKVITYLSFFNLSSIREYFSYVSLVFLIFNRFITDIGKCTTDAVYTLKDWCEINNQQQQQQQFHHQALHQKGWNNFGPIADWTSIDPAIVTSSRPLPFQTTSTWQFPHIHPSHTVAHNAQQVRNFICLIYF